MLVSIRCRASRAERAVVLVAALCTFRYTRTVLHNIRLPSGTTIDRTESIVNGAQTQFAVLK